MYKRVKISNLMWFKYLIGKKEIHRNLGIMIDFMEQENQEIDLLNLNRKGIPFIKSYYRHWTYRKYKIYRYNSIIC